MSKLVRPAATMRLGGQRIEYAPHHCFACGELSEHGLRLALHVQDGRCWTELALDGKFQGWDGIAHGGIVATILDEVMAWTLVAEDTWGVTARLNVTFHQPIPIGKMVRAEGWLVEGRRRISRTAARIEELPSGKLLASAEGTYVPAPEERRAELKLRYRFRLVPEGREADMTDSGAGR